MDAGEQSSTIVVVLEGDLELVLGGTAGLRPDLALVDALARLQLAARRLGCSIRLRDASRELHELLDLAGLGDLVAGPAGLPLDAGREAEGGEHLGVQEVVPPGDQPA